MTAHPVHPSLDDDVRRAEWFADQAKEALLMLRDCVEMNPGKQGGVPVLRGTRFPVARVFAELSEGQDIDEVADDFGLDKKGLRRLLEALALHLDRPCTP